MAERDFDTKHAYEDLSTILFPKIPDHFLGWMNPKRKNSRGFYSLGAGEWSGVSWILFESSEILLIGKIDIDSKDHMISGNTLQVTFFCIGVTIKRERRMKQKCDHD